MNIEVFLPGLNQAILISEDKFRIIMNLKNISFSLLNRGGIQFWFERRKWTLAKYILDCRSRTLKVDHENHNQFDYTNENLRIATSSQNGSNRLKHKTTFNRKPTSQYKGVCWHKRVGKWAAKIMLNYRTINLGYFDNELDAARKYNEAALAQHKDFAYLNILPDGK